MKLADYITEFPTSKKYKCPTQLPNVSDGYIAFYPGAREDKTLVQLLEGIKGKIIYQDEWYYTLEGKQFEPGDNVTKLACNVSGREDHQADLVYLAGIARYLPLDNFVEGILKNTKSTGILIGTTNDIPMICALAKNVEKHTDMQAYITGEYQPTILQEHWDMYPETMTYILDTCALVGPTNVVTEPPETLAEFIKQFYNGKPQIQTILERQREIIRSELESATSEFYTFLGDHTPPLIQQIKEE